MDIPDEPPRRWYLGALAAVNLGLAGCIEDDDDSKPDTPIDDSEPDTPIFVNDSALDLVLQSDQFGSGWVVREPEGNETVAESQHVQPGDGIIARSEVYVHESIEVAESEFTDQKEDIEEDYGTDTLDIGDEAIRFAISDSAWIIFRRGNVIVEVQYHEDFGIDIEEEVIELAEMVLDNFPD